MKKVLGYIVILIAVISAFLLWKVFGPAVNNSGNKALYIPTGATYQQVKDSLSKHHFLSSMYFFNKLAGYADLPAKVKPGKYKVENGMSLYHLIMELRRGRQESVNLVITKLRTKEDLAGRIGRYLETDSLKALAFFNNNDSLKKFGVDTNTVLTDVFPDTYIYFWTADMQKVFEKFIKEKRKFWTTERLGKAASIQLTPEQVYTLASIIEEETNADADKGKIASVYLNRLNKGMALAADPTIKFAMKNFSIKRIYQKMLNVASPYNTYKNRGLPPGPICTPSAKTIDAVLNAPKTDYLYFVAKPDLSGNSNFSATYSEHLVNAKAYQHALDSIEKLNQIKSGIDQN